MAQVSTTGTFETRQERKDRLERERKQAEAEANHRHALAMGRGHPELDSFLKDLDALTQT